VTVFIQVCAGASPVAGKWYNCTRAGFTGKSSESPHH